MNKNTKIALSAASILILTGLVIFWSVMTVLEWDFKKLSTLKYATNNYTFDENVKNIFIVTETADVVFVPSEDQKIRVVCYEQEKILHSVTVKDDTLRVLFSDMRKWYEHIGISFDTPKLTVYIPEGEYSALTVSSDTGDITIPQDFNFERIDVSVSTGDVINLAGATESIKIRTSTGNINTEGASAASLDLVTSTGKVTVSDVVCQNGINIRVTTGKTYLTNISCGSITSNGDTGSISLTNVIAADKLSIERGTGNVNLEGCDAADILIVTDTGSVKGTLLSEKIFITRTDTGRVDVPKTASGGRCEITTDTGNIKISID